MSTPALLLILLLALAGLSWFFIPIIAGIPFVPTDAKRIRRALEMAALQPGESFVDLGCGDGRVLIAAARDFGSNAIGVEISPLHCLAAWVRARLAGVGSRVRIRWGNIYTAKLDEVDVAFQYGHSRMAEALRRHLAEELHDGARLVSVNVDIPGWQPASVDKDLRIFLYRIPPKPGDLGSYWLEQSLEPQASGASTKPDEDIPFDERRTL
jgi:SAM-dependent methyltransferase